MANFRRAFKEMTKPILWVHYALGTLAIFGFYQFILKSPLEINMIYFYAIYIFVDRSIHGILELF